MGILTLQYENNSETDMKNSISILALSLMATACANKDNNDVVSDSFDFAAKQLTYAFSAIDSAKSGLSEEQLEKGLFAPRSFNEDGSLKLIASRDWCSGFFPGELWYMYEYTGDEAWRQKAEEFTAPVEREKTNGGTHDMGFKVYCSFGNGYRLTKNPQYKDVIVEAAKTLSTRYNDSIGCIRSWDHHKDLWQYPVIIDNMMNLELLYEASKLSGDSTYSHIATNHARTTMNNHFRDDFSSFHVVDYDTITHQPRHKQTWQGYADDSAWSRGQSWGLYGYTMCYRETGLPEFLDQAKAIAEYIGNHPNMPEDMVPYWDYNAPDIPNTPRDASAGALAACALYELSTYDTQNGAKYKGWADKIVNSLSSDYRAALGGDQGFLLLHSTGSGHNKGFEMDYPLIYADYYFLEALLKKDKLEKEGSALL